MVKTKEELAEYNKKWRENNKEKVKEYREENKEEIAENYKIWSQTPEGKKSIRISDWKRQRIICDDFDTIYEKYINCNNCNYCETEFENSFDRHLDHDHYIKDTENIRGILCRDCNFKDVLA